jgi:hypothetical protein
MIIEALSTFSLCLTACLVVSLKKNLEFSDKFDEIQEELEVSLDVLEEQIKKIDQKTKLEVFSDEPVVRNLLKDIVESKNAVINVAKLLDDSLNTELNESKETEE